LRRKDAEHISDFGRQKTKSNLQLQKPLQRYTEMTSIYYKELKS